MHPPAGFSDLGACRTNSQYSGTSISNLAGGMPGITRVSSADQQFVQLAPVEGQAARGWYAGVSAMYTPPEFNRFSQYYELRLYGIGLLPSRPSDVVSVVISRNVFSHYVVDAALQADNSRVRAVIFR